MVTNVPISSEIRIMQVIYPLRDVELVLDPSDGTKKAIQLAHYIITRTLFNHKMLCKALSDSEAYESNDNYEYFPLDTCEIMIVCKMAISGDANCDGKVDLSDSVMIMQSLANPDKYTLTAQGRLNADCTSYITLDKSGDGVTNMDALAIQQYALELIDSLPPVKE